MMQIKTLTMGSMDNNCYLLTDEASGKSALIDCPDFNADLVSFVGDADVQYILLTHGHYDHILGVPQAREHWKAMVYIGEPDGPMLESSKLSLAVFTLKDRRQTPCRADFFLRDGKVIRLGETEIRVLATPGHTRGGVCYLCGNALFTGDTLFRLSCGRTDFPGGSSTEMRTSLQRLAALAGDYTVYPGHGQASTLDFERRYNTYLR